MSASRLASQVTPGIEQTVGIRVDELAALYLLDRLRGFGPQKFKELWQAGLRAVDVVANPARAKTSGKRWDAFRQTLSAISDAERQRWRTQASGQITTAMKLGARIVTYGHPDYPPAVFASNNPVPILYVRSAEGAPAATGGAGNTILREERAVACVGSRGIRPPYAALHRAFAIESVRQGFTVVSGFALGADTIGHQASYEVQGSTIVVMPCGVDLLFPPENRELWTQLLKYSRAVFVSEFPFGMRAASLTLRKRNRLIVAFARGVLVSQSAVDGGAMNAYRFALEQRKPVATFVEDGKPDTSGNALIARAHVGRPLFDRDAVFPLSSDPSAYERWLRTLSSST